VVNTTLLFFALQIKRREVKIYERGVVKLELNRNDSINFTLRMPVDLRLELEKISKKEDRTITNLINMSIKRYIEMYNNEEKNKGMD
jgi:hypothetical protein